MEFLHGFIQSPLILVFLVAASAWVWEDAAVIAGALLAVDGYLSIPMAFFAATIGVVSGDVALYYLGIGALRWRRLRAWILMKPQMRFFRSRFKSQTVTNILFIRFVPGLRTVGFTLCGFWRIPVMRFMFAMLLAAIIWVALVFAIVYQFGGAFLADSDWKWAIMSLALVLLVGNNFISYQYFKRKGAVSVKQ